MIRCQSWCLLYNSDSRIFCTVKTSFILTVICCLQQLSVLLIFCINMSSILPFCSLKLLFVFVCGIQLIDLISAANTEQYRCQCWMVGKYGHSHWLLGIQVSGVRCVRFTTWRWQCSPTVCWRFVFCAATDDTVDRWWDTEIRGLFLSAATVMCVGRSFYGFVQFTYKKDQNVHCHSLYRPATCWSRWKVRVMMQ